MHTLFAALCGYYRFLYWLLLATCHGIAQHPLIAYTYVAAVLTLLGIGIVLLLFSSRERTRWQALRNLRFYYRPLTRR